MLISILAMMTAFGGGDYFAIVEEGEAKAEIVRTADDLVNRDIVFFTNAVFEATGAKLSVVEKPSGELNYIEFKVHKAPVMEEDRWESSFPDEKQMVIACSPVSGRWELNRILEEQCGYVACLPGKNGIYYGKAKSIKLKRENYHGDAAFAIDRYIPNENRDWERACGGKRIAPKECAFGGGVTHHNLYNILPISKYGKDPWREQVMPMIDGERKCPKNPYVSWHPCFASKIAEDEAVKNILEHLKAHPEVRVVSLGQTDGNGQCRCPECIKLNGGEHKKSVFLPSQENWSNGYFSFVNRIAERVSKECPDLLFGCMAYANTADPPDFKLHPKVCVRITTDIYQFRDPEVGARRARQLAAWNEKCSYIGVYDYDYEIRYYFPPRAITSVVSDFFKQKLEYPALGSFFSESVSCGGDGPRKWLSYRMMFDPKRDYETEMNRWCEACCGKEAAPHLRAYYRIWDEFWLGEAVTKTKWYESVKRDGYADFWNPNWIFALDLETVKRARKEIEAVVAAAEKSGDLGQRARAKKLRLFHIYYEARLRSSGFGLDLTDGEIKTADQTVKFVEALSGSLGKSYRILTSAADEICDFIAKDEPFDDSDTPARNHSRWMNRVESIRLGSYDNYFLSKYGVGAIMAFRNDPQVKTAIKTAAANEKTAEPYRTLFKKLTFENCSNWPEDTGVKKGEETLHNAVVEKDDGYFAFGPKNDGWCGITRKCEKLKPGHWYALRAVFRQDCREEPVWASAIMMVHGANWRLGPTAKVKLERGQSVEAISPAFLFQKVHIYNDDPGMIDTYIDADNLRVGESVIVEKLEILDMGEVKN